MSEMEPVRDSIAAQAHAIPAAFACSWSHWGLDAAWVDLAGELDLAAPEFARTLREAQTRTVQVLLQLAERGVAG
jgi:hypothetical protein